MWGPPIGPVITWKRDFIIFGTLLGHVDTSKHFGNECELNLETKFLVSSFPVSLEIMKDKSQSSPENWLAHAPCLSNLKTIGYSLMLI
jgi:hypothetical protein